MAGHYSRRRRGPAPGYLLLVLLLLALPGGAQAETVKLPMSFDFALLRALIIQQAYQDPGERAKVAVMMEGCNEIWLDNPQLQEDKGYVRFQTGVSIVWGTPVADNCFAPLTWSGTIILWQQPAIDDQWQLRLKTVNSVLLDQTGKQAALSGLVWDLVKKNAHTYIDSIAISLAPPVDNVKQFMAPSKEHEPSASAARFLASMRPEQPRVSSGGLAFHILAEADIPRAEQAEEFFIIESPEIEVQMMALWQSWDALLVNMMSQLSTKELTEEDRQLLLDTLLTVRYEFSEVLGTPNLTTGFIRGQFINSWVALKPLFQRHLTPRPGDSILGYLSFFTAADALVTLDRLGPLIGVEISREGFYRLAHMLNETPLNEGGAVDKQLRAVLGLGAPMDVPPPEPPPEPPPPEPLPAPPAPPELPSAPPAPIEQPGSGVPQNDPGQFQDQQPEATPETTPEISPDSGAFLWRWWERLFSPMEAQAATAPQIEQVTGWTAELTPVKTLLPRIYAVLAKSAASQKGRLDTVVQAEGWGEQMIMATAWHESCFRQFVVKDQKITYLLSYNNSSVGIMQVNEKVWRGIYDVQELRWNIEYNSRAGTEILALYLNRYLAKRKGLKSYDDADGRRYLAIWLYALYNGGPVQLKKFPARASSGHLNRIDKQFQEKYDQAADEKWLETVDCLPAA